MSSMESMSRWMALFSDERSLSSIITIWRYLQRYS